MAHNIIKLENLEKYYDVGGQRQLVIKGVDLEINAGETVAILGKSGSGKSTMLNILGLLDRPTGGKYLLHQKEISMYKSDELSALRSKTFGFIFQQFNLLPKMTVIENVIAPLQYSSDKSRKNKDRKLGLELLEKFGILDQADKLPKLLSGGQQQRVAIARSLINNPEVIIGDEPTGALDSKTAKQIIEEIFRLNREFGTAVILVTHDEDLAPLCQRTIHLKDGLVV